jgi:ferredoxin--NADP+ reductase
VALDLARVLAKTPEEMAGSDLCAHAASRLAAAPLTDIHLIGRRGPLEASFTPAELGELGTLTRAVPVVDPAELPAEVGPLPDGSARAVKAKTLEILQGFAARPESAIAAAARRIHLHFYAGPVAVLGEAGRATGLRLARTRVEDGRAVATGETRELPAATVLSAIGYRTAPLAGAPLDAARGLVTNTDGVVDEGLFVVGWAKRGPSGVIPANRADSMAVAAQVLAWLEAHGGRPGPAALDAVLAARGARVVTLDDWGRINAAEVARGAERGRPREKFTTLADMLGVLDRQTGAPDPC